MSLAAQYFSLLPFLLALSALVYVVLRKMAPTAARISLALGGAFAGGFLAPAVFVFLIEPFRDGWKNFGLFFWGVPIFLRRWDDWWVSGGASVDCTNDCWATEDADIAVSPNASRIGSTFDIVSPRF